MPDETITKAELDEFEQRHNKALKEVRDLIESKKLPDGETKERIEKVEKELKECEDFNQKLTDEVQSRKQLEENYKQLQKDIEEKAEILKDLEKKYYRQPNGSMGRTKEMEDEVLEMKHFIKTGHPGIKGTEYKYLRTDNNEDGGFLVPPAPLQAIVKKITETSDMRSIARVITTSFNEVPFPIRVNNLSVEWVGEAEQDTLTNQKYGMEKIPTYTLAATVPITMEEMQDSAFNMDSEIFADTGEAIAQKEGNSFIAGNAIKKPEGILNNPYIDVTTSGASGTFSADDLMDTDAELKTGYRNPIRLLTRKTLNHVRKLKGSDGHYLLTGLRDGLPATINGYPYKEMPDMEELGSEKKVMAFGDFMKGYVIVDRIGMSMIRDPYTRKRERIIEITFTKRVGGMVILAEAIKILQCAA